MARKTRINFHLLPCAMTGTEPRKNSVTKSVVPAPCLQRSVFLIPGVACVCMRVYGLGNTVGIWIAWSFFR
jgi:hypothetical protein